MAIPAPRRGPTRLPLIPQMTPGGSPMGFSRGESGLPYPNAPGTPSPLQPQSSGFFSRGASGLPYMAQQTPSPLMGGQAPLRSLAQPTPVQSLDQYAQNAATANLTDRINALTARSQAANPMVPGSPLAPPIYQPTQQQQSMIAGAEANADNNRQYGAQPIRGFGGGYADYGAFGPTPGMQYNATIPQTQAGMQNRANNLDFAANPGGAQMQQRFIMSPLTARADQYQRDQATADAGGGVFIQPGGYGSQQQFLPFNRAGADAFAQRGEPLQNMNAQGRLANPTEAAARDAARRKMNDDAIAARRDPATAVGALRAKRMASRDQKNMDRQDQRFRQAVGQGLNPSSARARALYPEAVKRAAEKSQPAKAGTSPLTPGDRTLEGQGAAADRVARIHEDPHVAGLGADPSQGLAGLDEALSARAMDPSMQFSDDSLKAYQQHAKDNLALQTADNQPFDFGGHPVAAAHSALWQELAQLPDDPRAREGWLRKYRESTAKIKNEMGAREAERIPGGSLGSY